MWTFTETFRMNDYFLVNHILFSSFVGLKLCCIYLPVSYMFPIIRVCLRLRIAPHFRPSVQYRQNGGISCDLKKNIKFYIRRHHIEPAKLVDYNVSLNNDKRCGINESQFVVIVREFDLLILMKQQLSYIFRLYLYLYIIHLW